LRKECPRQTSLFDLADIPEVPWYKMTEQEIALAKYWIPRIRAQLNERRIMTDPCCNEANCSEAKEWTEIRSRWAKDDGLTLDEWTNRYGHMFAHIHYTYNTVN